MPELKIESGEWVVVCDGSKALILENAGDARFPNLRTRETYEQKHPATHELGSDVPGRAFASVGNTRSAVEQTDWHHQSERNFLKSVASRLDAALTAGEGPQPDSGCAAARARHDPAGVFAASASGDQGRAREGLREASGPRDRGALVRTRPKAMKWLP